jgi:hypothetical protein
VSRRVRIGACANPADAALVRSVFAARDIPVVIGAEHHASLLGPIGGAFLSLDIWVAEEDAEDAAALLHDLREHPADGDLDAAALEAGGAGRGDAGDPDGEHDGGDGHDAIAPDDSAALPAEQQAVQAPGDSVDAQLERRRRTGIAILLGCFITFGTAHMSTRAWLRGIALAGLEAFGFRLVAAGDRLGPVLVIAAIMWDLVGAIWRIRRQPDSTLPIARLRR